jgi:drug/metabolite transporter (DMT)-like permease
LTFSTFPVFTILLEALVNREGISWFNLGLATVAIFGVYLVLPDLDWKSDYTLGFWWGIGSGASFSVLTLVNKNLLERYSSNTVSFWQNGIAALVLLPLFCSDILQSSRQDWLLLLILGILFTGIAHTLFINSMQHIKAQTASLVASLEPVYGILGAWFLLGQIPNTQTLLGGSLILAVAFVASMPRD